MEIQNFRFVLEALVSLCSTVGGKAWNEMIISVISWFSHVLLCRKNAVIQLADGERLIVAPRCGWYSFTQLVTCQITGNIDLYSGTQEYTQTTAILAEFLVFLLTVVYTARTETKLSL